MRGPLAAEALVDMGCSHPRIAVSGLNPHAGEHGLFGHEDAEAIEPAVIRAVAAGWNVAGPFPGDTLFHRAYGGECGLVVAMYHDQGHIPIKLVAFVEAVNVTLGLPIVRTSVDHGTAFDIVGQGVADHQKHDRGHPYGCPPGGAAESPGRAPRGLEVLSDPERKLPDAVGGAIGQVGAHDRCVVDARQADAPARPEPPLGLPGRARIPGAAGVDE